MPQRRKQLFLLWVVSGKRELRVQSRQEGLKCQDDMIRRLPAAEVGTASTVFGAERQHWQAAAFQKFVDTKHEKQLPLQQLNSQGNSSGWKHRIAPPPGERAWPREGCGLLAACRPLRARVRSRPRARPASPGRVACRAAANDCFRRRISGSEDVGGLAARCGRRG